jgi:hypothetical protein
MLQAFRNWLLEVRLTQPPVVAHSVLPAPRVVTFELYVKVIEKGKFSDRELIEKIGEIDATSEEEALQAYLDNPGVYAVLKW